MKSKFKATQPVNEATCAGHSATAYVDWGLLKWDIFSNSCVREEQVCARKISFRCDYFWWHFGRKTNSTAYSLLLIGLNLPFVIWPGGFPAPNHLPLYDWNPAPVDTYKSKNRRFSISTRARCLWTVSLASWAFCIDSLRIHIIYTYKSPNNCLD